MDMVLIRDEEFDKNTSRKIRRMGVAESVADEYHRRLFEKSSAENG